MYPNQSLTRFYHFFLKQRQSPSSRSRTFLLPSHSGPIQPLTLPLAVAFDRPQLCTKRLNPLNQSTNPDSLNPLTLFPKVNWEVLHLWIPRLDDLLKRVGKKERGYSMPVQKALVDNQTLNQVFHSFLVVLYIVFSRVSFHALSYSLKFSTEHIGEF